MSLDALKVERYPMPASVKATGDDLGRSNNLRRTSAPKPLQALFLCLQCSMAAVRGTPSGVPVSLGAGRPTCVQLPPLFAWPRTVVAPQQKELYS